MFENLSDKLTASFRKLTGQSRITKENIKDSLNEVRKALLTADVALPVVTAFIASIEERAIGENVLSSLTPGQALIKIVHDELVSLMGDSCSELNLKTQQPAVVLVAGLQGSGKTTSIAKLAHRLISKQNRQVLLASADVYRPAAILQLETLAEQVQAHFYPSTSSDKPVAIARGAIKEAKSKSYDVVIIDTAGRLHIDQEMMDEIKKIHQAIDPIETLFVVDAMTGQDAANTAKAFNDALDLTGVILTKIDGDARGGAALSVRKITGKPIKFLGVGEKTDALEAFHPDRIASRILGMGDILSLIEEAEQKVDQKKSEKLAKKLRKGSFDLQDFKEQLQQMQGMGGISNLLDKLPGNLAKMAANTDVAPDAELRKSIAIINSMTKQEKKFPKLINGSRKRRIALGSGNQVQDINRLLKQFTQMQKMMKKLGKKGGMKKMMQSMQQMLGSQGGMPPM